MPLSIGSAGNCRINQFVIAEPVARIHIPLRRALRKLMAQARHRKFDVRSLQVRIHFSGIDFDAVILFAFVGFVPTKSPHVQFFGLPGREARFNLLGKALGIGGGAEGFSGQNRGCLMVAVSVAGGSREARYQDIWSECTNHADDVS